jgi:hypothetical protein
MRAGAFQNLSHQGLRKGHALLTACCLPLAQVELMMADVAAADPSQPSTASLKPFAHFAVLLLLLFAIRLS